MNKIISFGVKIFLYFFSFNDQQRFHNSTPQFGYNDISIDDISTDDTTNWRKEEY